MHTLQLHLHYLYLLSIPETSSEEKNIAGYYVMLERMFHQLPNDTLAYLICVYNKDPLDSIFPSLRIVLTTIQLS